MNHQLLPNFVAYCYLELFTWLQLQIIHKCGSELIRFIIGVANIPFKDIVKSFVIQNNRNKILSWFLTGTSKMAI